eukprot:11187708-Lingulodinium_polyedra.AAC.2
MSCQTFVMTWSVAHVEKPEGMNSHEIQEHASDLCLQSVISNCKPAIDVTLFMRCCCPAESADGNESLAASADALVCMQHWL